MNNESASNNRNNWIGLIAGIASIVFAGVLGLTNFQVLSNDDLIGVKIILAEDPIYDKWVAKGSEYKSISFQSYEYTKPFLITNFTYNSVDHVSLKSDVKRSSSIIVYISKSDVKSLRTNELTNNYNEIYNLKCNGKSYVDLKGRNEYREGQNFWGSIFLFLMGIGLTIYYSKKIKKVANNG